MVHEMIEYVKKNISINAKYVEEYFLYNGPGFLSMAASSPVHNREIFGKEDSCKNIVAERPNNGKIETET